MLISLDTETTGIDFYHGAKPFLVTICTEEGDVYWWEWEVNPVTRNPKVKGKDLDEIQGWIDDLSTEIAIHNSKFDYSALRTIYDDHLVWDWSKVRDTLRAAHLIASNERHDLTALAVKYLGVDLRKYEKEIELSTKEARRLAKKNHPDWRVAGRDQPDMPSAKETTWKYDMWLPGLMADEVGKPEWKDLCPRYANSDSATTVELWKVQKRIIEQRGLWEIYLECLKMTAPVVAMEQTGVTLNSQRKKEIHQQYVEESDNKRRICETIAKSYGNDLVLPKSGNNTSLLEFCFGKIIEKEISNGVKELIRNTENCLDLPIIKTSKKTGNPSLDKEVLERYESILLPRSKKLLFVKSLREKRSRDTALGYLESYERYWLKEGNNGCYRLHPSLNPTGTDTLRCSSNNPNEQNISKKKGFNLRYCFGPAEGYCWASLDYNNIELRIPAYESGEPAMLELFENPDKPPYYGSYHLLIFDILHPDKFKKYGADSKNVFKDTYYQWTKNGNFADLYGAMPESGTADRAFHVQGAQLKVASRLTKKAGLNKQWIGFANKYGYVETIPDKSVCSEHGYPLLCTRSEYGNILPTVPLNYHVQGTAGWVMLRATVKAHDYVQNLQGWNMLIQAHDELVVEFPTSDTKYRKRLTKIGKLMESIGEDIDVKLTVSCDLYRNNWSESEEIK